MILFALGIIVGLLISILIMAILSYFKKPIERNLKFVSDRLENSGPRTKGMIIEPDSEADEVRARIISNNRKQGKDTHISELQ